MKRLASMCGLAAVLVSSTLAAQPAEPPPPTGALPPAPPPAAPPPAAPPAAPADAAPAPGGPAPAYPAYGEPPPPPPPSGQAYGEPPAYSEPPPPPRRNRKGVETHDGFYLRFGLGGGALNSELTYDPESAFPKSTLSGGAYGGHLMLGGTVAKGFVIGAAMGGITAAEPDVEVAGTTQKANNSTLNLSHLGLLLDWFPDEHGGFHVGGSLGVYTMRVDLDNGTSSDTASGGDGQIFAGYDFWVGDDWSIGGLLALTHASTELDTRGVKETASTNAFMLQFSVLYH